MNLCRFCLNGSNRGNSCLRADFIPFIGNRFPSGIDVTFCDGFLLREDKSADIKIKVGMSQSRLYYIIKNQHYYGKKSK